MESKPGNTTYLARLRKETDPLTERQVQRLVFGGAAVVALTVIVVYVYNGLEPTFDYLSYVCPCLGALVAGAAFYMGDHKRDRSYFFWSLALLVAGLACYALAHQNHRAVLLVSLFVGAGLCWFGFAAHIGGAWRTMGWIRRLVHVALAAALAYELVITAAMAWHTGVLARSQNPPPCQCASVTSE